MTTAFVRHKQWVRHVYTISPLADSSQHLDRCLLRRPTSVKGVIQGIFEPLGPNAGRLTSKVKEGT